jgi:hypothetical protein
MKKNILLKFVLLALFFMGITLSSIEAQNTKNDLFEPLLSEDEEASNSAKNEMDIKIKEIREGKGVLVTNPSYDDIGAILSKMGSKYNSYSGNLDSNEKILFMNCGSNDLITPSALRSFVENGGFVYASDLTSSVLDEAFPGRFTFSKIGGQSGYKTAEVLDSDLKGQIGETMQLHFDLTNWSILHSIASGDVLMRAGGRPVMVRVPYGKGQIFYTCFHNHSQASEKEEKILKLLVIKQVQMYIQMSSFSEAAKKMGIDLYNL